MAIKITEDGAVRYVNENDIDRTMFPNEPSFGSIDARLNAIESKELKTALVTNTTNANGSFQLSNFSPHNFLVLCVHVIEPNGTYYSVVLRTENAYWCTVKNNGTNANVASTSVNVEVVYIER